MIVSKRNLLLLLFSVLGVLVAIQARYHASYLAGEVIFLLIVVVAPSWALTGSRFRPLRWAVMGGFTGGNAGWFFGWVWIAVFLDDPPDQALLGPFALGFLGVIMGSLAGAILTLFRILTVAPSASVLLRGFVIGAIVMGALSPLYRQPSDMGDGIAFTTLGLIPGLIFGGTVGAIAVRFFASARDGKA